MGHISREGGDAALFYASVTANCTLDGTAVFER